jgi:hypothetical protein
VAFLLGRWRSDFGGKADFPTIPKFTYGEELDFSLSTLMSVPVLNYTYIIGIRELEVLMS